MITISKQSTCQKYIYKIHTDRLKKEKWKLTLPLQEARKNDEVIALASSQVLRWIDEINGMENSEELARELWSQIKKLRADDNSLVNRREISRLYQQLDEVQFEKDYMCLVIDKNKDYLRACKGFSINGIKYKRFVGTNGGIKSNTIVFVSEAVYDELKRRVANGRDMTKEHVPAKLEAYQALPCSASTPVSFPNGIAVVNDCETTFLSDIISLTDECEGEPEMTYLSNQEITIDASDGFGLMSPSLAERWSGELGLDYVMSAANTRYAFEKGMAVTFDFRDFADKVAGGKYVIKDAWGNDIDVRNVELILTTSMVKLWDSYPNCEEYVRNSAENHYTFGITKVCPKELENERNCNYQYLQSASYTPEDIEELIAPTVNEIREVLHDDWRKSILFLKGVGLSEKNVAKANNDFIKAIMIDPRMIDDPYVQNNIYTLIKNRINDAKVGVIKVHGNYSIVCGDPYALCQSMFGLPVTGLLKAGEIYNKYWVDCGAEKLCCFRSPMSCFNNIRAVVPVHNDLIDYWYKYIQTCTVFNAWDTAMPSLNGLDFDGDLVFLTDNSIILKNHYPSPALMCIQRKAEKKIPTEEDIIQSNIDSFGNDIGKITNRTTSMYEGMSYYSPDSDEYKVLDYRIKCGQLYQQNAIDKAKGIIAKPMPREWYDLHSVNTMEDGEKKDLYRRIVAEKKPYFMRYIYPDLKKEFNQYIKNTNRNALREFRMTVPELMAIPPEERTDRQNDFVKYYEYRLPVGTGDCVMNRICRRFEEEFDGYLGKHNKERQFDYTIMKSNAEYTATQFRRIKSLYEDYNRLVQSYTVFVKYERVDKFEAATELSAMGEEFRRECDEVCQNRDALCNIVLDLCYSRNATKRFAWDMCGDEIIHNLLEKNGNTLSIPVRDDEGDITYCGDRFRLIKVGGMEK